MKKKYQWATMIDFQSTDLNQGDTGVQGLTLLPYRKKGVGWRPRRVCSPFVCMTFSPGTPASCRSPKTCTWCELGTLHWALGGSVSANGRVVFTWGDKLATLSEISSQISKINFIWPCDVWVSLLFPARSQSNNGFLCATEGVQFHFSFSTNISQPGSNSNVFQILVCITCPFQYKIQYLYIDNAAKCQNEKHTKI